MIVTRWHWHPRRRLTDVPLVEVVRMRAGQSWVGRHRKLDVVGEEAARNGTSADATYTGTGSAAHLLGDRGVTWCRRHRRVVIVSVAAVAVGVAVTGSIPITRWRPAVVVIRFVVAVCDIAARWR